MKKTISFILILCCISAFSQKDSIPKKNNRIWKTLKYDMKYALKGAGHTFTQPIRWQKDDILTATGVIAGTAILYISDTEANDFFLRQEGDAPQILKEFGWYFGSPQNFFMATAGIYAFGLITDNEKVRYTGVLIISSAATTGLIQTITKTAVGRARPSSGNYNDFKPFSSDGGFHSFPSGHSVLSFTMAHAIAKQFDDFWTKAGIYTIGSIAPISRLWANAHWLSDVGLGMALAVITVDSIDNFMKKKQVYKYEKSKKISWQLRPGYGTIGIVGTF